ncbi:MAG: beta-N-acetylhexosaminidase [Spirochaetales bacterium]|nr:beta-N-acetylhexosaminidase [Spirochaetales bacterium]
MTREELRLMIGQHLVCGFDGTTISDEFRKAVSTHKIANVILFARNIESREQLMKLTADIRKLVRSECHTDALICVDQEGGMVTRLSSDFTNIPGAMALSATGESRNAYDAGFLTATELRSCGVNVDFAPTLDVNSNPDNPVIGVRSYSDDPSMVSEFGGAMARGLRDGGVMACGKHFPGHGDTHVDSHLSLPTVAGDISSHLQPFKVAIDDGIEGIMSSHILFPELEDRNLPATMSRRILTDLLKKEMGFEGLVFSDCMEMKAIADNWGTVDGSLAALQAGVDIVCISHHVNLGVEVVELMEKAIQDGTLGMAGFMELKESTQKILRQKKRLAEFSVKPSSVIGTREHARLNRELHERSITLVNDVPFSLGANPLFIGPRPFRATNVSDDGNQLHFGAALSDLMGGEHLLVGDDPTEDEIGKVVERAKSHESVVVGTYNGHLHRGQLALANAVSEVTAVCVFALRNPYDLSALNPSIRSYAAWSYTPMTFEAIARVLNGEIQATGRLPIRLGGRANA